MKEGQPSDYQFKHNKRIYLDSYNGVASDLMELNDVIADGFMRLSDLRSDVVITQKPHARVVDYDQVGFVRVAKVLSLPRLDFWKRDGLRHTRKDGDVVYIAIDDQKLADEVARADNTGRFDDAFIERFRQEVEDGLRGYLKKEKLLNGGKYNYGFALGYLGFLSYNLVMGPGLLAAQIASGADPALSIVRSVGIVAVANTTCNTLNLFGAGMSYLRNKYIGPTRFYQSPMPDYNDPFIKHSVWELPMPPVPVDRLIRGLQYLDKHGEKLIEKEAT